MSSKRITFIEWVVPFKARAKVAEIKLSNKNIKKLRSCYISWYLWHTLNNMFRAVYTDLVLTNNTLASLVSPRIYASEANPWCMPVVLSHEATNASNADMCAVSTTPSKLQSAISTPCDRAGEDISTLKEEKE